MWTRFAVPVHRLLPHCRIPTSNPWEQAAKIDAHERQKRYRLATDRNPKRDYEDGQVRFGRGPDNTVYFQVVLRDYLKHRDEASLREGEEMLEKIKRLPTTLP